MKIALLLTLGLLAIGPARSAEAATMAAFAGETIGAVATNLVNAARQNDFAGFRAALGDSAAGGETNLVRMVLQSAMLENHHERTEESSPTEARLNYHDLARGCHFQVILRRANGLWEVARIYFCR